MRRVAVQRAGFAGSAMFHALALAAVFAIGFQSVLPFLHDAASHSAVESIGACDCDHGVAGSTNVDGPGNASPDHAADRERTAPRPHHCKVCDELALVKVGGVVPSLEGGVWLIASATPALGERKDPVVPVRLTGAGARGPPRRA